MNNNHSKGLAPGTKGLAPGTKTQKTAVSLHESFLSLISFNRDTRIGSKHTLVCFDPIHRLVLKCTCVVS